MTESAAPPTAMPAEAGSPAGPAGAGPAPAPAAGKPVPPAAPTPWRWIAVGGALLAALAAAALMLSWNTQRGIL